jgi:hypothetical protein
LRTDIATYWQVQSTSIPSHYVMLWALGIENDVPEPLGRRLKSLGLID